VVLVKKPARGGQRLRHTGKWSLGCECRGEWCSGWSDEYCGRHEGECALRGMALWVQELQKAFVCACVGQVEFAPLRVADGSGLFVLEVAAQGMKERLALVVEEL
jgi:hypothetical protein